MKIVVLTLVFDVSYSGPVYTITVIGRSLEDVLEKAIKRHSNTSGNVLFFSSLDLGSITIIDGVYNDSVEMVDLIFYRHDEERNKWVSTNSNIDFIEYVQEMVETDFTK